MRDTILCGLGCVGIMGLVVLSFEWWQVAGLTLAGVVLVCCVGWRVMKGN